MAYLNANIPLMEAYIRTNFLQNRAEKFDPEIDTYLPCTIFAVASIPHRVPLFHFHMEDGGVWFRMPIHAFCSRPDVPQEELHQLMMWDCFSHYVTVTKFDFFAEKKMFYLDRKQNERYGKYLYTIDWAHEDTNILDVNNSQVPGEHKCGHVIQLDDGNYGIQPNNRVKMFDPSTSSHWGENILDRKIGKSFFTVENQPRWMLSGGDKYDYDVVENKK